MSFSFFQSKRSVKTEKIECGVLPLYQSTGKLTVFLVVLKKERGSYLQGMIYFFSFTVCVDLSILCAFGFLLGCIGQC